VPILLVMPSRTAEESVASVPGRVVGLPVETASALGLRSLSVEVDAADATAVAAADDVRVVLVEPSVDPAAAPAGPANDTLADGDAEQGGP
jgi:hypothetical protein